MFELALPTNMFDYTLPFLNTLSKCQQNKIHSGASIKNNKFNNNQMYSHQKI